MKPTVIVEGVDVTSRADCPYKVSSPEGIAWCREFTRAQSRSAEWREIGKAQADERMVELFGTAEHRSGGSLAGYSFGFHVDTTAAEAALAELRASISISAAYVRKIIDQLDSSQFAWTDIVKMDTAPALSRADIIGAYMQFGGALSPAARRQFNLASIV